MPRLVGVDSHLPLSSNRDDQEHKKWKISLLEEISTQGDEKNKNQHDLDAKIMAGVDS